MEKGIGEDESSYLDGSQTVAVRMKYESFLSGEGNDTDTNRDRDRWRE